MATILVVDDDPDVRSLTRMTFECEGHEVMAAADGGKAIALAEETPPDAIVLDVMLPDLTGWQILERLRERPETRWVPVLMLSALDDTASRVRGLRNGAEDYLSKPFEPAELAARVGRLVQRRSPQSVAFEGRLSVCPLAEIADSLEQNEHSGVLDVRSAAGDGAMALSRGRVVEARFEGLAGAEAVRALLELEEGYFRFQEAAAGDPPPARADALSVRRLALEVAWLRDELERRIEHLPPPDQPLTLVEDPPARAWRELSEAAHWVREYLRHFPGVSLQGLLDQFAAAPGKVRLAVAQLVERGAVRMEAEGRRPGEEDVALDRALRDLFQDSVFRGLSLDAVRVVQLFEPGAWSDLEPLIREIPEILLGPQGVRARERLLAAKAGEIHLQHRAGHLVLEIAPLSTDNGQLFLPLDTTGVVVWLAEGAEAAPAEEVISRLDGRGAQGVQRLVLAASEELRRRWLERVGNRLAWRVALDRASRLEDVLWGLVTG